MANKNIWLGQFDPSLTYIARKPLKHGDTTLHAGREIPEGAFNERRMRQLYESRKIIPADPQPTKVEAPDAPQVPAPEPIVEPDAVVQYEINQRGAWADIMLNGEKVEGPMRAAAARDRLAELNASL